MARLTQPAAGARAMGERAPLPSVRARCKERLSVHMPASRGDAWRLLEGRAAYAAPTRSPWPFYLNDHFSPSTPPLHPCRSRRGQAPRNTMPLALATRSASRAVGESMACSVPRSTVSGAGNASPDGRSPFCHCGDANCRARQASALALPHRREQTLLRPTLQIRTPQPSPAPPSAPPPPPRLPRAARSQQRWQRTRLQTWPPPPPRSRRTPPPR